MQPAAVRTKWPVPIAGAVHITSPSVSLIQRKERSSLLPAMKTKEEIPFLSRRLSSGNRETPFFRHKSHNILIADLTDENTPVSGTHLISTGKKREIFHSSKSKGVAAFTEAFIGDWNLSKK